MSRYKVLSIRGRPVLAIPSGAKRLELGAVTRYQPQTLKKALLQQCLLWTLRCGLDRWTLAPSECLPKPFDSFPLEEWLADVGRSFGYSDTRALIVWPTQPERQRVYLHLLRPDGAAIGFAKISLDSDTDERLVAEAAALEAIRAIRPSTFHVPAVLAAGWVRSRRFLVLEPVPASARPVRANERSFPRKCLAEYASGRRTAALGALAQFAWWRHYRASVDPDSPFAREVEAMADRPAVLTRVHGDLGPANMLQCRGRLWILDWEESNEWAPRLTDPISFDLGLRSRLYREGAARAWERFARRWLRPDDCQNRCDVLLALAFLCGAGREDAIGLVRAWPSRGPVTARRAA
ncbi:MAG: hypothetical protein NUV77_02015 [Thermoguttaceae bacterium]|jgi:hypothetical protein|nr:hypothetical protein [Thermoguttaceae bacterium]